MAEQGQAEQFLTKTTLAKIINYMFIEWMKKWVNNERMKIQSSAFQELMV